MRGPPGDSVKEKRTYESGVISRAHISALRGIFQKGSHDSTFISSMSGTGPVEEFEDAFARESGATYALALSSCTAALHTALMAAGIGPGDEVIVSPYSWGQSVSPVLFVGATAVFADICPETLTLDSESVENRLSSRTKAIIPVHLFGNPADMDRICCIAQRRELHVISDAAQAFGALSKGRKIGGLGNAACFSLGRGKALFGGEGGVMVTKDQSLYERAIAISQHPIRAFRQITGAPDFLFSDEVNWNYRIHPLAAVLASADLKVSRERLVHRKKIYDMVLSEIKSIPGIEPVRCYTEDSSAAYSIAMTYKRQGLNGISRESFIESLYPLGVVLGAGPVKVSIHMRPTFQRTDKDWFRVVPHPSHEEGSCPVSELRCKYEELQLLDANMLDKTEMGDATEILQKLREQCHYLSESKSFDRSGTLI